MKKIIIVFSLALLFSVSANCQELKFVEIYAVPYDIQFRTVTTRENIEKRSFIHSIIKDRVFLMVMDSLIQKESFQKTEDSMGSQSIDIKIICHYRGLHRRQILYANRWNLIFIEDEIFILSNHLKTELMKILPNGYIE